MHKYAHFCEQREVQFHIVYNTFLIFSGKARRGDGNDLTANPRKLAAIGKELDQLSRVINDMTPVSEMPFGARCKSRKEKNKLASRACRLKKKAQHEANKVKCDGLLDEHRKYTFILSKNLAIYRFTSHLVSTPCINCIIDVVCIISGDLGNSIERVKALISAKMDPNCSRTQAELTAELDHVVNQSLGK